jgi:hypothetical protein
VTELACQVVAEAGGAHAGNRQSTACDHQRRRREIPQRGVQAEPGFLTLAVTHALDAATGLHAHAGLVALIQEHLHDQLGRDIAEQLPQLFLVVGDAVALDQVDEVVRCVARQCRLAEMRIGGQVVRGRRAGVGEIAAAAAGHQDLLADAVGVFDDQHALATPARGDRAHQAGGAAAHDHGVEMRAHSTRNGNVPSASLASIRSPTFASCTLRTTCPSSFNRIE